MPRMRVEMEWMGKGARRRFRTPGRSLVRVLRGVLLCALVGSTVWSTTAQAFRLIGVNDRWVRWDAAPRFVSGEDRSLDGGLRYSIGAGSYEAMADQLSWLPNQKPTGPELQAIVARAFEHWTVVDPGSGLPAGFHFVEDLGTTAVDAPGIPGNSASYLGLNPGAEIDLFVATPHPGSQFAASVIFFTDTVTDDLTLTSGTTNYPGFALTGADIRINPLFLWPRSGFEALLTHEIGHALGLADLEAPAVLGSTSPFLDDDYDPSSPATALSTLSNDFALAIDPLDPNASGLFAYFGAMNTSPGLDTIGVEIMMESDGYLDRRDEDPWLHPDDFAGRQFLYPVTVPEPGLGWLLGVGSIGLAFGGRKRRRGGARGRS